MTNVWKEWEGQTVNHSFVLGSLLGGSERSAVFLTQYGEPQSRKAVIKLTRVDPDTAAMEQSCLESAARLSYPCLIRLFDWGLWRKGDLHLLYTVMEYADEDLSKVQRPLTATEAQEVWTSAASALAYLHREGFVHGHLKPSNILAVGDQVKLSSDGLLRMGDSAGAAISKPGIYDPPEASRGEILPASDVWALGLIMVQALTRQLPSGAGTADLAEQLPHTLPEPLLEIARQSLQADPRRRATPKWIRERLTPEESPAPRTLENTGQLLESKVRRYAMPLAAGGVAVGAVLIASVLFHRPADQRATPSQVQPAESRPARETPAKPGERAALEKQRPSPSVAHSKESSQPRGVVSDADRVSGTGSSINSAPGDQANGIVHQVLPNVPAKARNTIQGKIQVGILVQVDGAGDVIGTSLQTPRTSHYFANLALQAARGWKFAPAGPDGSSAASNWLLRFEFRRTKTDVHYERVSGNRAGR